MAATFECFTWQGRVPRFRAGPNGYRLGALHDAVSAGTLLPLDRLLAGSPGEVMAADRADEVQTFYGQAYALILFLQQADHGRYASGLRRLVADGLNGRWPLDPPSQAVALNRNVPKTMAWNRVVGPRLFQYYVTHDLHGLQRPFEAFCEQLVSR